MDLLVAKDWFAAAEKLATRFGGEEGSEHHLGAADMFPDVIIPGEQPKEPPAKETVTTPAKPEPPAAEPSPQTPAVAEAKAEPAPETVAANPPAAATVEPAAATSIAPPAAPAVESATASVSPPVAAALPAVQTAHAAAPLHAPQASEASFVGVFTVGAGLCVALVLLFGLTFLVLRPK
jgi:hypothetical protein